MSDDERLQQLCAELTRRLRAGERCCAEELIDQNGLPQDERALELIYAEFVVRMELGERPDPEEWYVRFPAMQADLQELFQVHRFVTTQPDDVVADETLPISVLETHSAAGIDTRTSQKIVGDHTLIEEIGRGGMGVVYRAYQRSVGRDVALKMMLARDPASPSAPGRLRREATAAAALQHPNIAQVYESGVTDGWEYFSMELVEGPNLEALLAKAPMVARSAARLVEAVARAVEYAHQCGVIHRDLKPSNILLTPDGEPKVTDFGLAKRIDDPALSATRTGVILGTPSYIPPELIEGGAQQTTPRVDVYSLGAVLYECLTGRPPFVGESALETLQQVRERDPVAPRQLAQHLPSDLETICLTCLEKDPSRRYATPAALADDLRRYQSSQPIAARKATAVYRFRKFASRNRHLVGGVAVLFATLLAGVVATSLQAVRTMRQKQIAESEAAVAASVGGFLEEVFTSVMPSAAGNSVTVQAALDRASELAEEREEDDPRVAASIRRTIGEAYMGLGAYQTAEPHLRVALELVRATYSRDDPDLVSALNNMGRLHLYLGEREAARPYYEEAIEISRSQSNSEDLLVDALRSISELETHSGRLEEAETASREAVSIARDLPEGEQLLIQALHGLALILDHTYQVDEALAAAEEAREIAEATFGEGSEVLASCLWTLAYAYSAAEEPELAIEANRRAVDIYRQLMAEDHPRLAVMTGGLARRLSQSGEVEEAERLFVESLEILERQLGPEHRHTARARAHLGFFYMINGRLEEAEPLLSSARTQYHRVFGKHHQYSVSIARNLGGLYWRQKRYAKAEEIYKEAVELSTAFWGPKHLKTLEAMHIRARNRSDAGDLEGAIPIYREAHAMRVEVQGANHPHTQAAREALILALRETGKVDEANALIQQFGQTAPAEG